MKKFLLLVLIAASSFGCKDYDARFDELNRDLAALEADNRALESQIAAILAQDALIAQATADQLGDFQEAVEGIIRALQTLGVASELTIGQIQAIITSIASLTDLVNSNSENLASLQEEINQRLDEIQSMLDTINENVLHHSGGGAHHSGGGSHHHSGGGS